MKEVHKTHALEVALGSQSERMPSPPVTPAFGKDLPPLEQPLYNDPPPNATIDSERPEHRIILYLKCQGLGNREIAERTNYSYGHVCQVIRQPWFRAKFIQVLKETQGDSVESYLRAEALNTLETLVEIRDTATTDGARVAACNALADRIWGKAVQKVQTQKLPTPDEATTEMAELEKELANLKAQAKVHRLDGHAN